MMKAIFYSLILISVMSCKIGYFKANGIESTFSKSEWKTLYKKRVITICLQKCNIDLGKDNSDAIQFEVLGANPQLIKEIDSLGQVYARKIGEYPSYFEGKPIVNMSLTIYTSEELDKISEKSYKKYNN